MKRNYLIAAALAFFIAIPVVVFGQGAGGPFSAPSHEVFLGPSIGKQWTGVCTASGATPQTCNATKGAVTTNSLSTAAGAAAAYVINDTNVLANSILSCDAGAYSGTFFTNGVPAILSCVPAAGTITVTIGNTAASNALAGTLVIYYAILD